MSQWLPIIGYTNGEFNDDAVLNRPVRQLRERTDFLYAKLNDLIGAGTYQTLQLTDVALSIGTTDEPQVQDVVYLNPSTKTYAKAIATVTVAGSVFQTASDSAYAMGILTSKSGSLGTVTMLGRLNLRTTNDWDLSTMLETGETFRAGAYYLSPVEAGKITSQCRNVAIYLGYFVDSAVAGFGGYAVLNPQYKDVGEAHMHRAIPLAGRVAGTQVVTGTPPSATHALYGFEPSSTGETYQGVHTGAADTKLVDTLAFFTLDNYVGMTVTNVTTGLSDVVVANNTTTIWTATNIPWDTNDRYYLSPRCRLIVTGQYSGDPVAYTLTLTNATGIVTPGAYGPINGVLGFEHAYMHWSSSDAAEGSGLSQITGYNVPVPIGTKGLYASLENVLAESGSARMWNWCEAGSELLLRRQWVINAPEQAMGWRARRFFQYAVPHVVVDGKFSLVVHGSVFSNPDTNLLTTISTRLARLYQLDYTTPPVDGDTITINGTVYEFDLDGVVTTGHTLVPINSYDVEACYVALLSAVVGRADPAVFPAIDKTNARFMFGVPVTASVALSVGFTGATVMLAYNGADGELSGGVPPALLVYDNEYNALVTTTSYWQTATFYAPALLTNGLQLTFIPFAEDLTPVVDYTITATDNWVADIVDEAPGALFEYSLDVDESLRKYYPPTPLAAAGLVTNGLEMENRVLYPGIGVYQAAFHGLYWFSRQYGQVPWPVDWVSYTNQGAYAVWSTFHTAHTRLANTSVVTSIQPVEGSAVKLVRCGTNTPATTGDLAIDLNLELSEEVTTIPDFNVHKRVVGSKIIKGPVVSKLLAGAGISLSSSPGAPAGCGEVMVSLASGEAFSGDITDIALDNAKQELIGMFPYIRLLGWTSGGTSNVPSGFVGKFVVPQNIVGSYQVAIYMTMFGEDDLVLGGSSTTKLAGLEFSYSILRDYNPAADTYGTLQDNLIVPSTPYNADIKFGNPAGPSYHGVGYFYKSFNPFIVHNNPADLPDVVDRIQRTLYPDLFPIAGDALKGDYTGTPPMSEIAVQGGNLVGISVKRRACSDPANEYTGKLGIARLRWQLVRLP